MKSVSFKNINALNSSLLKGIKSVQQTYVSYKVSDPELRGRCFNLVKGVFYSSQMLLFVFRIDGRKTLFLSLPVVIYFYFIAMIFHMNKFLFFVSQTDF